jgi:plasmid stability protein
MVLVQSLSVCRSPPGDPGKPCATAIAEKLHPALRINAEGRVRPEDAPESGGFQEWCRLISFLRGDIIYLEEFHMAAVVIRNLPDATHRALKLRAKANGRSTEAEIRVILENAVKPAEQGGGLGSKLAAFADQYGGIELEIPPRTEMVEIPPFDDHS